MRALSLLLLLMLAACSQDSARRFGEALIAASITPKFVINGVYPIWKCGEAPDPLYPCYGMGPEGFVRDLVGRPLFNHRTMQVSDIDRGTGFAVKWTWFSMQGVCKGSAIGTYYVANKVMVFVPKSRVWPQLVGATRPTAMLRNPHRPVWPPQPICDAQAFDVMTSSRPFSAALWIWMPEPEERSKLFSRSVTPSPSGRFDTGCRWEKRSGLDWQVCRTAIMQPERGSDGKREDLMERWQASLGDTGFHIQITGHFYDPLFLWPQWYAERRAGLLEVIDSVRLESAPPPTPDEKAAFPGWLVKIEEEGQANLRRVEQVEARMREREQERAEKGDSLWWQ